MSISIRTTSGSAYIAGGEGVYDPSTWLKLQWTFRPYNWSRDIFLNIEHHNPPHNYSCNLTATSVTDSTFSLRLSLRLIQLA